MKNNTSLPELILEQYVLGELDEKEMKKIQELEKQNQEIKERIQAIRQSNEEILSLYTPQAMTQAVLEKRNKTAFNPWKIISSNMLPAAGIAGLAAAAAAITVFFTPVFQNNEINPSNVITHQQSNQNNNTNTPSPSTETPSPVLPSQIPDTTRPKGNELIINAPHLILFKKALSGAQAEAVKLNDKSVLKEGDEIQVRYYAGKFAYGIIISIDGRGAVTLHSPSPENASTELTQYRETFLNNSFKLDDAPYFERFFFIVNDKPVTKIKDIMSSAKKFASETSNAAIDTFKLSDQYTIFSIIVYKEEQ